MGDNYPVPAPVASEVQAMFGEIATRYDLLNRLLSFGMDQRWRAVTMKEMNLQPEQEILDLCCGTGDLSLGFARQGCKVTGADFTGPMLPLARAKAQRANLNLRLAQADAEALPFADGSFDAVTISFGIRNVRQPKQALKECLRVLRPGGKLGVLEFFPMKRSLWRTLFRFYFHSILPLFARIFRAGRGGAYRYLPASVDSFVSAENFKAWLQEIGFEQTRSTPLTGAVAHLQVGVKSKPHG